MSLPVTVHIWLAALLIVIPVPEAWVKVVIALVMVLICALVLRG